MIKLSDKPNRRKKAKDPDGSRSAILASAVAEFAAKGLHGARIAAISTASGCDKQLIYYYFGSKEDIYVAALEYAYSQIRLHQTDLQIDESDPLQALIEITLASYDFVIRNTELIRIISNENLEEARYLKKSPSIKAINAPIIAKISHIIDAGVSCGKFRSGLDAIEIHRISSALINHNCNNAHTFSYIFDVDLASKTSIENFRKTIADVIGRFVARIP